MYKIEYLKIAKKDIDDIIFYIRYNLNNKKAALTFANLLIKETNNILKFPYGNAEYLPIKSLKKVYRKCKVKNYLIFYTINEVTNVITIVRVLCSKRDLNKILN